MKYFFLPAILIALISCNDSKKDEAEKLNKQSLECIRILNESERKMNAALQSGDQAAAMAYKKTMDSAAMENAKIGQELMKVETK